MRQHPSTDGGRRRGATARSEPAHRAHDVRGFPRTRLARTRPGGEGALGNLWRKSYRDYEIQIRRQFTEMFASAGFDARRDIAGIVLNRWGHSYVVPEPGSITAPRSGGRRTDVLTQRAGRMAFGHCEINGMQEWFGGVENGERAMRQVLEVI